MSKKMITIELSEETVQTWAKEGLIKSPKYNHHNELVTACKAALIPEKPDVPDAGYLDSLASDGWPIAAEWIEYAKAELKRLKENE